jgi:hypothetical protein
MEEYRASQDAWFEQMGDQVDIAELFPGEDYFICYNNHYGRMCSSSGVIIIKGTYQRMTYVKNSNGLHLRPEFKNLSVFPSHPETAYAYETDYGYKVYHTPESAAFMRRLARKRAEQRMRTENPALGISLKEELLQAVWEPTRAERTGLLKMAYDEIDAEGF